jgi:sarcosine oxidase
MTAVRVIVVGAGINGLCAAWALTRAGHRVTVIDAAPIPNVAGTSYDQHRLTRIPYGDQEGYTRMMADATSAWDEVWRDLGARHIAETGCLALCTSEDDWTARSARVLDRLGIGWERLAGGALARRYPMLETQDALFGLAMRQGGALFADRIMDGLVAWLAERGVELRGGCAVREIDPTGGAVVTVDGYRLAADALIVTAGAWTGRLFPALASDYVKLRQLVAYVAPPPALAEAWAAAPVMLDMGGPRGMYLAPPVQGRGFKLGVGAYNRPCPLEAEDPIRPEEGAALLAYWRTRLRSWEEIQVLSLRICYYAHEARQRFILRRFDRAWVLTGCSGHGFKFGPLMGRALAAAALGRHDAATLGAWAAGDAPDLLMSGRDG